MVTQVAVFFWVGGLPFFGGFSKKRFVEDIGFGGVRYVGLSGGKMERDQMFFDGIGVHAVVDFCQVAFNVPTKS